MVRVYLQSIRLALCLVCIGASIILVSHWLGLRADENELKHQARRQLCETIALNSTSHIRKQQWLDLQVTSEILVDRYDDLLSIGIRNNFGDIKADAGHHQDLWDDVRAETPNVAGVSVPITLNQRPYGNVELVFRNETPSLLVGFAEHPLIRLVVFFCIAASIAYTVFLGKMMRVFNRTQVIPDRVRSALDTLAEGLLVMDERGKVALANHSFSQAVDLPTDVLLQSSAQSLPWTDAFDQPCKTLPWAEALDERRMVKERILHLQVTDNIRRIFSVNSAPIAGDRSNRGVIATFRDVTQIEEHRVEIETTLQLLQESQNEIERKNRELEILASRDALTGCLNRRAFFEQFGKLWRRSTKRDHHLACIMVDNDYFKRVNDTYGHTVGDEVLREVSKILLELEQTGAVVCRYGGEEFCVLLSQTSFDQAKQTAEEIRQRIEALKLADIPELTLSASLGVTERCHGALEPQALIDQADSCMYVAKRNGRNQVVGYDPNLPAFEQDVKDDAADEAKASVPPEAVSVLISSLAYRDVFTAEHCQRVAMLCDVVSEAFMDQGDQYTLRAAALLHDIGKISVPDSILMKQGRLRPDEIELLDRHESMGVSLIETTFGDACLTGILTYRNAHFDGSGRRRDLPCGVNIPIGARILAICDSYDSMVSDQVYRKGSSHEVAIAELRRYAGSQFDRQLVEHFAQVVSESTSEQRTSDEPDTAVQICFQVERILEAVEHQDAAVLSSLSSRLSVYARSREAGIISQAADYLNQNSQLEAVPWEGLLAATNALLSECRKTVELVRENTPQRPHLLAR